MNVVFRADASLEIGSGHIMRCLTLADGLRNKGVDCSFICRKHAGNLLELISESGYTTHLLPLEEDSANRERNTTSYSSWLGASWNTDAIQSSHILNSIQPDWLIVDHYSLDERWESLQRGYCKKIMVIDDLADRTHDCELLLDQNLGRSENDYKEMVSGQCVVLVGPQYALLRPEFMAMRDYSLQRRTQPKLERLLISMGGVDLPNATGQILESLKHCTLADDCQIAVVMGGQAPWLEQVTTIAKTMPWRTKVLNNINNMAKLMAESDLAIGAAGMTSWERACLGLPTLLVILAENQRAGAYALHKTGAAQLLGDYSTINENLANLLEVSKIEKMLADMSQSARELTDGQGVMRVIKQMECCH